MTGISHFGRQTFIDTAAAAAQTTKARKKSGNAKKILAERGVTHDDRRVDRGDWATIITITIDKHHCYYHYYILLLLVLLYSYY